MLNLCTSAVETAKWFVRLKSPALHSGFDPEKKCENTEVFYISGSSVHTVQKATCEPFCSWKQSVATRCEQ